MKKSFPTKDTFSNESMYSNITMVIGLIQKKVWGKIHFSWRLLFRTENQTIWTIELKQFTGTWAPCRNCLSILEITSNHLKYMQSMVIVTIFMHDNVHNHAVYFCHYTRNSTTQSNEIFVEIFSRIQNPQLINN